MTVARQILRSRSDSASGRVTYVELFFDLVFVFAVTQLSHRLLGHLDGLGALQAALLLTAVWWVWIFTAWVTNWVDPDRTPVRLMLFGLMLAGLVLSASIPQAFESRGLAFAGAYVIMQVGRSLFMLWALRGVDQSNFRTFQRITAWLTLSGVFWIGGALADGHVRLVIWAVAMLIEFASPSLGFWVPGLGRSVTADWTIEGGHMAERCGLFIIISLGESILVTGASYADLPWSTETVAAFVTALIGSIAMWWIYFNIGAERGTRDIKASSDPGRIARVAYTYVHLVLVAGIIVSAVADELILKHPHGHAELKTTAVLIGGPALYLAGNLLFKWTIAGWPPLSHLAGLALLAVLVPVAAQLPILVLGAATSLVLVVVTAWETISLRSEAHRGVDAASTGSDKAVGL
jgi:low temperature requirement protein LtrA